MSDIWPADAPSVGESAEITKSVTVDDMRKFLDVAGATTERAWVLDEELAAAGPFGRLVVQSGVITGVLGTVVGEKLPGPGCVFVNTNLDYLHPVHPGQTITGRVEVIDVQEDKPLCTLAATVTRDDDVVAVKGTITTYTLPGAAAIRSMLGGD